MDLYLFHQDEFQLHYNCSFYSVEVIPLETRRHPVLGWGLVVLFFVFEIIYAPCIVALARMRHQSSCYKFMLYISAVDMMTLPMSALLTGVLAIEGSVYCSRPMLILIAGSLGDALWFAESATAMCLALNRCVELYSPHWGAVFFEGHRAWWWLLIPTCYALFSLYYQKPLLYSAIFVAWFFNPHIGYFEDPNGTYYNIHHVVHNAMVIILLPTFYLIFTLLLWKKLRVAAITTTLTIPPTNNTSIPTTTIDKHTSAMQRSAFIQAAIIAAVNASGAAIYEFMQFFPQHTTVVLIHTVQYMWAIACGMPALIYLALNPSIRRESSQLVSHALGAVGLSRVVAAAAVTTAAASAAAPSLHHHHHHRRKWTLTTSPMRQLPQVASASTHQLHMQRRRDTVGGLLQINRTTVVVA